MTDVLNLLDKLDDRCALSPDGNPDLLSQKLAATLALPLFIMLNESLNMKAPIDLINMHMLTYGPIFTSKGYLTSNYRPMSLTFSPCRMLKKLIKKAMSGYCNRNDLLNKKQFGFMK